MHKFVCIFKLFHESFNECFMFDVTENCKNLSRSIQHSLSGPLDPFEFDIYNVFLWYFKSSSINLLTVFSTFSSIPFSASAIPPIIRLFIILFACMSFNVSLSD